VLLNHSTFKPFERFSDRLLDYLPMQTRISRYVLFVFVYSLLQGQPKSTPRSVAHSQSTPSKLQFLCSVQAPYGEWAPLAQFVSGLNSSVYSLPLDQKAAWTKHSELANARWASQFDNQAKNAGAIAPLLQRRPDVTIVQLDAYSRDHGRAAIVSALKGKIGSYNVVAASLGPKPSAVALYQLHCSHSDIPLAYAPSRQLSLEYSTGIGEPLGGDLDFESGLIDPFDECDTNGATDSLD
jgi:hypothetical protein